MAVIHKRPPWFGKILQALTDCWRHHAPCERISVTSAFDDETGEWRIVASPVHQEVFGGERDGSQVWTAFTFDATDILVPGLFRVPGLVIENVAVTSCCAERSSTPMLVFKAKCDGEPVSIRVHLQPVAGSQPAEVIDTIRHVIRERRQIDDRKGRPG